MQVPPVVAPTIPSPFLSPSSLIPTINPSPIILLLILPTLPLLLFGIGARPPNLAKLPFSPTELFLTGGCVTLAGGVVLGLAIWPEGMQALGSWMSGGEWERWDLAGWDRGWWGNVEGAVGGIGTGHAGAQVGRTGFDQPTQGEGDTSHTELEGIRAGKCVKTVSSPRKRRTTTGAVLATSLNELQLQLHNSATRTPSTRSAARLAALRQAFWPWYDPSRPHVPTALFVAVVLLTLFFLAVGHLLGAAYDSDPLKTSSKSSSSTSSSSSSSSSSSKTKDRDSSKESWSTREFKKRKEEQDDPSKTGARVKADLEKDRKERKMRQGKMSPREFDKWRKTQEREREQEMSKLRKMLEKEGLPLIALGVATGGEKVKEQGNDQDGEQSRGEEKDEDDRGGDEKGKDSNGGPSWGSKMKSSLVPKRLARAVELAKNGPPGQSKRARSKPTPAPGPGPGWEPANQALVDATLAQSAMSAQGNAERLKAEMAAR
ncbi:hypothetical protein EHS25_002072 [Saitozyma podzolica]|uniref:Uncharacterized protein n=1 Tax=Saitozyma podzolica TaxID=1890683 RepID=A0A427YEL4_9TREE|nr:hypothetical protein EHS25_002072 [Saitozyma podzolica]